MVNESDYILELPWLNYDREGIKQLCPEDSDLWFHGQTPWGTTERLWRWPMDRVNHHPLITDIVSQITARLPEDFGEIICGISKFPPQFDLAPHCDYRRESCIMLPLILDDLAPVRWLDDHNQTIFEHQYRIPTMIRTMIKHAVLNRNSTRMILEVYTFLPWPDMVRYMSDAAVN